MALQGQDVPWFIDRPADWQISPAARQLLEKYSGVPAAQVIDHIVNVRDEAWKIHPYPCLGQFGFLSIFLNKTIEYPDILHRLKNGQTLLDIGCCFGQETRQLVADGAPSENIYGSDIVPEFIELGYKLFKDRDSLKTQFVTADIFDPKSALTELHGQFDIIYAGAFFHLWGWADQVEAAKALIPLLRPRPGSIIVGRQVGSITPGEKDHSTNPKGKMFRHNIESFEAQWKEIAKDVSVSFAIDAKLFEIPPKAQAHQLKFHSDDTRGFSFVVKRE